MWWYYYIISADKMSKFKILTLILSSYFVFAILTLVALRLYPARLRPEPGES